MSSIPYSVLTLSKIAKIVANNPIIPSAAITKAINLEIGFEKFPDRASPAEARPHTKQMNPSE